MSAPDDVCMLCGDGYNGGRPVPADTVIAAPRDTGPFTNVEESFDFRPTERWDMPVCNEHAAELLAVVGCHNCGRPLPRVDGIENSSGTVILCRPCNKLEMEG